MQQKYKLGICSCHGKERLIYNKRKNQCYYGYVAESRKRTLERKRKKGTLIDKVALQKFYKQFWDSQPVKVCYETEEPLFKFRSWHVHHIIEKAPHPEHIFNMDVCVLLTLQMHRLWHDLAEEDRPIQMPKTYARYIELKNKYL